jgi:hypothetical protein
VLSILLLPVVVVGQEHINLAVAVQVDLEQTYRDIH